jgi:UTP--glucose-1-phosphate uridylyltransferase
MVDIGEKESETVFRVKSLVEKTSEEESPSNFSSCGSYLLAPDILPILEKQTVGKNGEILLADSINELAKRDAVYGCFVEGVWHDTGNQLGYIKAVVDYRIENEKYGKEFEEYLRKRLS